MFITRMNVNSFQDREYAIIDQALPSNRLSMNQVFGQVFNQIFVKVFYQVSDQLSH